LVTYSNEEGREKKRMIIDCHTHIWEFPKHLDINYIRDQERRRGDVEWMKITIDKYLKDMDVVDKAFVIGLNTRLIKVPNDYIAKIVDLDPKKFIGFGGINPLDDNAVEEIEHCICELGLYGIKLHPAQQGFFVNDRKIYPIYEKCEELGIPVMIHLGAGFSRYTPLKYSIPMLLEDVLIDFPDLKIIIAHLGRPWEHETCSLLRKYPNAFADISILFSTPFRLYNDLIFAIEFKVDNKLFFGSDYPFAKPNNCLKVLKDINKYAEGTGLPKIPQTTIEKILDENIRRVMKI